uniref:RxLR effector candidate protein n=1 Tax=Hyaloperonospora arabidopsidis (strain Emoy2) TaxID=559515 RepID=M4BIV3_HYAAE
MLCEQLDTISERSLFNDRPLVANLQSLYKRAGRSFSDGPSSASDVPCHIARKGPKRPPSVASKVPNYPPRADSRATGRGNSSDVLSYRGGLTVVPRGSVDDCEYQSMDEVEEGTHPLMDSRGQSDAVSQLDRVTCELHEDLEHEKGRRLNWLGNAKRPSSDREKDRAGYAFAQLVNEREQRSLRDELMEARQNISRLCGEISELQTRAESQHREHKYLLEMLERKGFLHRKNPRTDSTA